jgi:hypothetical protein
MLLITHTAVGILIASSIENPYLGSASALFSHYLLDIIPHEPHGEVFYVSPDKHERNAEINKKLKRRTITSLFDLSFSLILICCFFIFIKWDGFFLKSGIIFFSLLPDVLTVLAVYFPAKLLKIHHKYHFKLHEIFKLDMDYFTAYGYQILLSLLIFFISYRIFK